MKTRFFAMTAIAVLLLNVVGSAAVDTKKGIAKKRMASKLVSILPASDGVAVFDSRRFLNEALPKVVSANQPMLAEIMSKVNEMETRTGIDLRKFEQVAVGVAIKQISAKEVDYEPVAIANGDLNTGALIALAKLKSNGTYREEKIGDRTVYVFSAKDMAGKAVAKAPNSKIAGTLDKALKGLTKDVAVVVFDQNTLVLGSLSRVRETLGGTSHVPADVTALLSVKETAVMSFAFKTPGGVSKMLPIDLDSDDLGKNIDSIQYLSGSLDIGPSGTSLQVLARTKKPEQAQGLKNTLDGLQAVGGAIFAGSKRPDQQVYGRIIRNARIGNQGNDVTLGVLVPQADIDILIAGIK